MGSQSGSWGDLVRMLAAWVLLWTWHRLHADLPCWLALAWMLPAAVLIFLGMLESALLRRRAWLGMYLRADSGWFRWLRGGVFMVSWQALKASLFAAVLLVAVLQWPPSYWLVLLADALLLWGIARWATGWLVSTVRPGFAPRIVRRALVPVNTLVCGAVLVALAYYSPHPDYRGGGLLAALEAGMAGVEAHCAELGLLARLDAALEAGGWWFAQAWLGRPEWQWLAPVGWLGFLGASMAFVWGYSRLLLGAQVGPRGLFGWLDEVKGSEVSGG